MLWRHCPRCPRSVVDVCQPGQPWNVHSLEEFPEDLIHYWSNAAATLFNWLINLSHRDWSPLTSPLALCLPWNICWDMLNQEASHCVLQLPNYTQICDHQTLCQILLAESLASWPTKTHFSFCLCDYQRCTLHGHLLLGSCKPDIIFRTPSAWIHLSPIHQQVSD